MSHLRINYQLMTRSYFFSCRRSSQSHLEVAVSLLSEFLLGTQHYRTSCKRRHEKPEVRTKEFSIG